MTVAVGINYEGGVLLCADSQFTYGSICKTKGSKLTAIALSKTVNIGFALAGSVKHARRGIRHIVGKLDDARVQTFRNAMTTMESAHEESYRKVQEHPKYGQYGGPDYWLLIAVWIKDKGLALYSTSDDTVDLVSDYASYGSGDYLFRFLLSPVYRPSLNIQQAVTIAAHAFEDVKNYDPNVGFNSEFMRVDLKTGDISSVAGYDIGHVENFGRVLKRHMYELLFVMADLRSTEHEMDKARQCFLDNLQNLRNKYSEDKQHRKGIAKLTELLQEPGPKRIKLEFRR